MYLENETSIKNMIENKKRIDYEYLHPEVYTRKIIFKKAFDEIFTTLRTSGIKRTVFKIYCRFNKRKIFDKTIKYNLDDQTEIHYKCTSNNNHKIAIYTAIFGGYDELKEPKYISPACDYFVFTDMAVPENSAWKKIDYSFLEKTKDMDAYHLSKFFKIFPNEFFKEYDYSIWVDGTTTIVADLYPFIDRLGDKTIGMFDNPVHDCVYIESNFLLYYNRVQENVIKKQIDHYKKNGFPKHYGMFECTIIARKHNDKTCLKLMNEWWDEIIKFSMRDQISFPYILWKNNAMDEVVVLGNNRNFNPRLKFDKHSKMHKYK